MDLLRKYLLVNVCRAPDDGTGAPAPVAAFPAAAPTPEGLPTAVIEMPADTPAKMSPTEAGRALAAARRAKNKAEAAPANPPVPQERQAAAPRAENESTPQGDDAGEQQAALPGETESVGAEAELPPIEPPRSWTKADKELFAALPRDTQERLVARERSRESDFSQRQQKATEASKALEAERAKVEQARQQYDQALPQVLSMLQAQQAGEFGDVKSLDDVQKLAAEDPFRFSQWQAHNMRIAAVAQQVQESQQRKQHETRQKFAEFAKQEDTLLAEKVPEMADATKSAALQKAAVDTLKDIGFSEDELVPAWRGQKALELRDHRVQRLIIDATKWREAQAKAKTVQARPVPPVQRPGIAQPKGAAQAAQVESLSKQLDGSSGIRALRTAASLLRARRSSR